MSATPGPDIENSKEARTVDLILWRHAEAEEHVVDDLKRALTRKGRRQAKRMAGWLDGRLPHSTRILVSPALRCQQTAEALELEFRTVGALGPGAGVDDVLNAAGWPDTREPVLVVGHQPTLGQVAARLLGTAEVTLGLRKGAVWWLRAELDDASHPAVTLRAAIGPDLV